MPDVPEGSVNPAAFNENAFSNRGGQSLPETFRHEMQVSLGADLSAIRVHENHAPTHLGALSFSAGNDVYFAPGEYQPHTDDGRQLLSHELTHVVQQRQGKQ